MQFASQSHPFHPIYLPHSEALPHLMAFIRALVTKTQ